MNLKKKIDLSPLRYFILGYAVIAVLITSCSQEPKVDGDDGTIERVPFTSVKITDDFWGERLKVNREVTIPLAFGKCESTGRVKNFQIAGGLLEGDRYLTDFTFDDTDIYKTIEGASYSLQTHYDQHLVDYIDSLLVFIKAAQQPDGYLYPAGTITDDPEKRHDWIGDERWEKEEDLSHELYNLGHLIEAGVAHFNATNDSTMLKIAMKFADLAVKDFGWGKIEKAPGHQVVEMALTKLYKQTGKQEYLDLAKFFLDVKGQSDIVKEHSEGHGLEYSQAHDLVTNQDEAVGHAVRATYMYSGMADIASLMHDTAYLKASDELWENAVTKKTYVTGGIGSTGSGEAFGANYELPNMSAYCETCASIGNVYWNDRLFLLHGESKYYDVLERSMYNSLLAGISLNGDAFFYPNPLKSMGQHHRSEWFGCSCCPSNVTRFIPSVPQYIYAKKGNHTLFVNLFISNEATIKLGDQTVGVVQESQMPFNGLTKITIHPESKQKLKLMVRIPGWAQGEAIPGSLYAFLNAKSNPLVATLNGEEIAYAQKDGYMVFDRQWSAGDEISFELPMNVHRIKANESVAADKGKIAFQRGPIVYCAEWVDNPNGVHNLLFDETSPVEASYRSDILKGVETLTTMAKAYALDEKDELVGTEVQATLIPYYSWVNRGSGDMAVWLPINTDELTPIHPPSLASESEVAASHKSAAISALNDQMLPQHSNDRDTPYYHWWPKYNTTEWISYDLGKEAEVSESSVYWFDDSPWGGCRVPQTWKVYYKSARGSWAPVKVIGDYEVTKDQVNTVHFTPVTTSALKLEVVLPAKHATGIYEWSVD